MVEWIRMTGGAGVEWKNTGTGVVWWCADNAWVNGRTVGGTGVE